MCGVVGILKVDSVSAELGNALERMVSTLVHRGPDDSGIWLDATVGIALGHRRLSVIDLSPQGHQPMVSASGRYVISFNGEIYNFRELRTRLEATGHHFRGHSDTEVILAAVEQWGFMESLKQFVGMFALALWDKREQTLHLARDRLGEKPLYYGWVEGAFLFASELKALRAYGGWRSEIDRDALALFLKHNYVPAPYTIYKDIHKLLPGTVLTLGRNIKHELPNPVSYWSAREAVEKGIGKPWSGSAGEAVAQLDSVLRQSIRQQMIADVPLGAFLSGGVDSSAVVAVMQAQSPNPVRTFTVGFREADYNEAEHARAIAAYLGTHHTELYVTPQEAMEVIPQLPTLYDEPFADSSQVPTYLIARLARRHVTVSLSGDGGDELFGGYNRYLWGRSIWRGLGWLPRSVRELSSRALTSVPPRFWDKLSHFIPGKIGPGISGDRIHKLAELITADNPEDMYQTLVSYWRNPCAIVIGGFDSESLTIGSSQWLDRVDLIERMMYLDLVSYLPDDILVKVDRASMAVSLEARVPLLDHRVVEFAWKIPLSMKIRDGHGKWLLRQVLYKYVPRELVERPKMGFGVPIDSWLRGPLREWAEALLSEDRLSREGFFHPQPIRQKWLEHLSGTRNWQYCLWDILMFQAWLEESKSTPATTRSAVAV